MVNLDSRWDVIARYASYDNSQDCNRANLSGNKAVPSGRIPCRVVHSIPGRVRFRVPRLADDADYAHRLETLMASQDGVIQVRVRRAAASIVIAYNNQQLSDVQMRRVLLSLIQTSGKQDREHRSQFVGAGLTDNVTTLYRRATARLYTKPALVGESQSPNPNPPLDENDWSQLKRPALATLLALLAGPLRLPIPQSLVAGSVAIAGLPVAKRAVKSLLGEHRLTIDCLDLVAITLSSIQGNWLTPALMMTLHELGDIIRDRTARSTHAQATDLLDSIGQFAWMDCNGEKQQVPLTQVQPGDTVIVYPGEQIPVDGVVLRGNATIDQQKLTGESMPVVREAGQTVYASTLVRSGELYIKVERVGADTCAGASIQLVQQAPVHDTRMENYAAQLAERSILPAFLLATGVWAITRNPARAASILTLDFVTGMRVSIPTTFLAALTHATRHGILIRSGRALEQLAQVDTIVFDKTGTLTQGNIQVVAVETVTNRLSAQRILELAAAAEQRLTHPVAEAVMRHVEEKGIDILPRGEWHYEVGLGVRAEIAGERVLVGSDRFLRQAGISVDCFYDQHPCCRQLWGCQQDCPISADSSLIYVACEDEFQGVIQYKDPLRTESRRVIHQLQHEYGMEIHLLTGDSQTKAIAVAQELDIPLSQVHAEAFPQTKADVVRRLKAEGKTVAFTGDGLNDSVALAYADVSISFGDGSAVARETADVVLMENGLASVLDAIAIAKQTRGIVQQNTALAVTPNLAALGLASTVGLHPLVATGVHNGSAIAAGLNALRPLMHRD
ncbi:MAG: heavy metal translocating P-type ATPase [Coleofasciculus sp. G3-WIS-01]|uniref:heavy metal translocating P-type ATPase n=1 Tax=Coleofasciculus sp. G3-WIS-01 TaxID=3069528 RepID=UPI0032FD8EC4